MALLQISEPGQSSAPHQHRLAIGIDLGTTNSLVASVCSGTVTCLPDHQGQVVLPSVVRFLADGSVNVGVEANRSLAEDPKNTIASVKRFMGRGHHDIAHIESMPYHFIEQDGMVRLNTVQGVKSPVEISAQILRVLVQRAEETLGGTLSGAVITVPAYFDDAQRQATRDAAQLAGLNVFRLLNEPTAAAVAYGLENAAEGIYAVYDLGGGTFDLSILKLSSGIFEVLATSGDSALGGDDFDHRLYCALLEKTKIAPPSDADQRRLMAAARQAKETLTTEPQTRIALMLSSEEAIDVTVSRDEFIAMTATLVEKTLAPVRRVLRDARLKASDIKGVVMVGGGDTHAAYPASGCRFFWPAAIE